MIGDFIDREETTGRTETVFGLFIDREETTGRTVTVIGVMVIDGLDMLFVESLFEVPIG